MFSYYKNKLIYSNLITLNKAYNSNKYFTIFINNKIKVLQIKFIPYKGLNTFYTF